MSGIDQSVGSNGNGRLLTLVDALDDGMLDESQQELVAELRRGILALV